MVEKTLCPICRGNMVSRANKATGQRFWGCAKYPRCTGTRDTDGNSRAEQRQPDRLRTSRWDR